MALFLNRERMRVVERNEKGSVTYRKKYHFGQEVDTDHLDEAHVQSLVDSGALVESKDDLTGWQGLGRRGVGTQVTGAATEEAGDHSEIEPEAEPEDNDESNLVSPYDSMDYAELQQAAKNADLNAGGSAQDLRDRLKANDES